jgi:hypothetical protein
VKKKTVTVKKNVTVKKKNGESEITCEIQSRRFLDRLEHDACSMHVTC